MANGMPGASVEARLARGDRAQPSPLRTFFTRLLRSKVGTMGFLMFMSIVVVALLAPLIAPHDPTQIALGSRLLAPAFAGGTTEHLLGTDQLGRDVFSQLLYGARISLSISTISVFGAFVIGSTVGILSGYYLGIIDTVFMRTVDSLQSLPNLVILMALIAVLGPSFSTIIIVFTITGWTGYARIIRGEVLSVKSREFIEAARAAGMSQTQLLVKHLFPNVISSALALAALALGTIIIAEAALSYLGLGAQEVTWGRMLAAGREYVATAWWLAIFPGLAIVYTVLGIVFFGDWVRDYADPKIRGRF
ncbi:MAG: ABC transporter permease [Thermaerobacterales bacterium]